MAITGVNGVSAKTQNQRLSCGYCKKTADVVAKLLCCDVCNLKAFYCSVSCQTIHANIHKPQCVADHLQNKINTLVKEFNDRKDDGIPEVAESGFYPEVELPHEFGASLQKVFSKYKVDLGEKEFNYSSPNDFGRVIKSLFMAYDFATYFPGLEGAWDELGINVKKAKVPFFPRDHFLLRPDGDLTVFVRNESQLSPAEQLKERRDPVAIADERGLWSSMALNVNTMCFTTHGCLQRPTTISGYCLQAASLPDHIEFQMKQKVATMPFYAEGGNISFVTNSLGATICLMGKESFNNIFMEFLLKGAFDKNGKFFGDEEIQNQIQKWVEEYAKIHSEKASLATCRAIAQEMYVKGLLKYKGKSGAIPREQVMSLCALMDRTKSRQGIVDAAAKIGLIEDPHFTDKECQSAEVYRYMAQKGVFLEKLLPSYFGIDQPICVVPQCSYHLDTFLHPGPNGTIFLQDCQFCVDILELVKKQAKILKLSPKDLMILDRYITVAKQLQKELGHMFEGAKVALKSAGFTPIPTPGVFFDNFVEMPPGKTAPTFHFNFLNAISGFSKKIDAFYCITGGANVGDKLGGVLMEAFRGHLKTYVPKIKVLFAKGGMNLWNRLNSQAGLHCFTTELEVDALKV